MTMKKLVALGALAASLTGQAATTSTTSLSSLYQQLKESPLSFDIISETAGSRGTDGFQNVTIGYLGYKLTDKDSVKLENRVSFDQRKGKEDTYMSRTVLSYNRGQILTQDADGINMSAKIEQRWLPSNTIRAKTNQNGLTRLSTKISRSFGNVFSLSGTLYGAVTHRKNKEKSDTVASYTYLSLVENFQLTDKWYVAFIQEPYLGRTKSEGQTANIYNVLETGYQFTPEFLGAVYTANTLTSDDGKNLSIRNFGSATRGQEYAFYLMLSAF